MRGGPTGPAWSDARRGGCLSLGGGFLDRAGRLLVDRYGLDFLRAGHLGLEVLIIADIILTVAIAQTLENAITLGVIVLVRTFLSFSLDVEMDGVVPWRRRASERQPEP